MGILVINGNGESELFANVKSEFLYYFVKNRALEYFGSEIIKKDKWKIVLRDQYIDWLMYEVYGVETELELKEKIYLDMQKVDTHNFYELILKNSFLLNALWLDGLSPLYLTIFGKNCFSENECNSIRTTLMLLRNFTSQKEDIQDINRLLEVFVSGTYVTLS